MKQPIADRVPFQFYASRDLRDKALAKARLNGTHLSEFMTVALKRFIDRPIEKSMKELRRHNRSKDK